MNRFLLPLLPLALLAASPAWAAPDSLRPRLEELAASGSGEAAYHLGMIHHLGLEGAGKDASKAFAQFKVAAERGDALGAYKLGCFYAGQGGGAVTPDPALALRWKTVAAEAGYALAQEDVAHMLLESGDSARALGWYEAAARQGSARALMTLGVLHDPEALEGPARHVPKDLAKSYAYLSLFFNLSDRPEMAAAKAAFLKEVTARMSKGEIERAEAFVKGWRTQPTPLTAKANLGLAAAEQLVSGR
jgi:TPR repeat protein